MDFNELPLVRFVQQHRPESLDGIIAFLSLHVSYVSVIIVLVLIYRAFYSRETLAKKIFYRLVSSLLVSGVLNLFLKLIIARPRPFRVSPDIVKMSSGGGFSFPSGHTTEVFVLVFVLWPFVNKGVRALLLIWALFISYSRVALGVHYPTDVAGGVAVAALAVWLSRRLWKNFVHFKTLMLAGLFLGTLTAHAQREEEINLRIPGGVLSGTLLLPADSTADKVVLIIGGSGPVDRDGNFSTIKTESYRMLADSLAAHGIASLRYDKRGTGKSRFPDLKEEAFRFDTLVADAVRWIRYLREVKHFPVVVIAGHSQGSLTGILAAKREKADAFISLEGAGFPLDQTLRRQLADSAEPVKRRAYALIDSLKAGKHSSQVPLILYGLFRPSVQSFMISWMRYDPAEEIAGLKIPVLIVQGEKDLQVTVDDAGRLHEACPGSRLEIIPAMNHILKQISGGKLENRRSYADHFFPLAAGLVKILTEFIENLSAKNGEN